jgi:acetyl esterase/lipase
MDPPACCARQRRSRAALIVAVAALCCSGCTELGLWTLNAFASFSDYSRRGDISYGSEPANRLDLYLPRHPQDAPVVVFFFGGGWNSGDKSSYKFVGAALAAAGIIVVVPNYTLYPKARFPAFMHDAAQAVAWTRTHAPDWGGDPQRLFVVGHSAGAHIAVLLALDPQYLQQVGGGTQWLRGVVGLAGPYDFLPFTDAYLNDLFGPPARFALSQPINFVRAEAPPLLLMHGLQDRRVSPTNTRRLSAALHAAGADASTQYFERADHAALVAAFSIPERSRLPVLPGILDFIARESRAPPKPRTP